MALYRTERPCVKTVLDMVDPEAPIELQEMNKETIKQFSAVEWAVYELSEYVCRTKIEQEEEEGTFQGFSIRKVMKRIHQLRKTCRKLYKQTIEHYKEKIAELEAENHTLRNEAEQRQQQQ